RRRATQPRGQDRRRVQRLRRAAHRAPRRNVRSARIRQPSRAPPRDDLARAQPKARAPRIDINNEPGLVGDLELVLRLAEHHLGALFVSGDADLAILMVDEPAMEQLHIEWMDEPGPTDVLSFPMDELRPGTADKPTPPGLLGDIVVCPQVAE